MAAKDLGEYFEAHARAGNPQFAIALAILKLAEAQQDSAAALRELGVGSVATDMGAMHMVGVQIANAGDAIAAALQSTSD